MFLFIPFQPFLQKHPRKKSILKDSFCIFFTSDRLSPKSKAVGAVLVIVAEFNMISFKETKRCRLVPEPFPPDNIKEHGPDIDSFTGV
jgi:hypothetical protein